VSGRRTGGFTDWSLINPQHELRGVTRTEVAIVGSGYGGAVTAARLAAGGAKVTVLERGLEWLPGDFPESLYQLSSAERNHDLLEVYDLYTPVGGDLDIVAGSGVGGTSLLNAAISVRPPDLVLEQPEWPAAIRAAHADGSLARYYDRAAAVLQPHVFTGEDPAKVAMLRAVAAAEGGGEFGILPVNIAYAAATRGDPRRPVHQPACTLCGNCTTGCNVGAKSTLQANYLPMARAHGASIFAGVEVDRIERRGAGWRVHYTARNTDGKIAGTLDADRVIVAGGSLGSTEIMMRSAAAGLAMSAALGTRLSTNGDMLGFCYNGDAPTNLIGMHPAHVTEPVGTALMGFVDYRGAHARGPRLEDQFLLLESSIPVALGGTVAKALAAFAHGMARDLTTDQLDRVRLDLDAPDGYDPDGGLAHSTLYLACGHDDSGGRYVYRAGERPQIVWPTVSASPFVATVEAEMRAYTNRRGGIFFRNPRTVLFGGRLMVPHPLGGCPMADDARRGVVDHYGRVFDGGGAVHRGLHVLDGSTIPRSLAATPLLTISALAERAAEAILAGTA
jgi:cholesterol oxidase